MGVPVIARNGGRHDHEQRPRRGTMNSLDTKQPATADADRYLDLHMARVEADRDPGYHTDLMTEALRSHVPANASTPVLEIGPGSGTVIRALRDGLGRTNITAVDLAQRALDDLAPLGVRCVRTDDTASFLRTEPAVHGLIVMLHVLEHVPPDETVEFLAACRSAMAPAGHIYIEVPNMANPFTGSYYRYADLTHRAGFTEESLMLALELAGFTHVTISEPASPPTGRVKSLAKQAFRRLTLAALKTLAHPHGGLPKSSMYFAIVGTGVNPG